MRISFNAHEKLNVEKESTNFDLKKKHQVRISDFILSDEWWWIANGTSMSNPKNDFKRHVIIEWMNEQNFQNFKKKIPVEYKEKPNSRLVFIFISILDAQLAETTTFSTSSSSYYHTTSYRWTVSIFRSLQSHYKMNKSRENHSLSNLFSFPIGIVRIPFQ